MRSDITPSQHLSSLFTEKPCWMIEPLAIKLQYSIPSVRRFLTQIGYYSSFTHNGTFYTLRSIPRFDRDGLWFHQDIGFSNAGSLTNALIKLTTRSPAGMPAEKLGERLRCRCHSVLVQLYRQGKLQRQKHGRAYVYIAADPYTAAIQRQAMTTKSMPQGQLPAEIAVLILAEYIRCPGSSFEQLASIIVRSKKVSVDAALIEQLFEQHNLKKTM